MTTCKISHDVKVSIDGHIIWLFAGSQRAGQRMAAILSLLETAKLNGHDPYVWLRDVLTHIKSDGLG